MFDSVWETKKLGELTFGYSERAGKLANNLMVYGVDRQKGLTSEPRYTSEKLDRYKVIKPGMFAYNPMRLNIGSIGYCSDNHNEGLVSPDYIVFGCKEGVLDPDFLNYVIKGSEWMQWTSAAGVGSVRHRIYYRELATMPLTIPPYNQQIEIVKLLYTLDNKIALNCQINQTLEQIAQAIFKSWFVDFEPVKTKIAAKENGQDPERAAMRAISGKSDEQLDQLSSDQRQQLATTTALFPDELVDSELGEIPKGWSISEISDIADVIDCLHAKKPERVEENTGNIFLQLNNIADDGMLMLNEIFYISDEDYEKWVSRIEVSEGDCVITNVGRVGAVAQIPRSVKAALGRNMTAIRCKADSYYPSFLITQLTSPYIKKEIELRTDVGTILNALNVRSIPKLRFVRSGPRLLKVFENYVSPLQRKREIYIEENLTLSLIRDALLPKLLSGEISLNDPKSSHEIVTC